jgi:hypothetical protein
MNATVWLRISSVISLLLTVGHTLGGMESWSPLGETEVLASMRTFRFDVEGFSRSYLDFFRGFGFVLSVFFLLQAVVLWQLATIAKTAPRQVRPVIGAFALAAVAILIVNWSFLFAVPVIFQAALTGCIAVAFFSAA